MKRLPFSVAAVISIIALAAGCTPSKEDTPPKPKVSANASEPTAPATTAMALPTLGQAPKWELKDLNGATVSSEQFKGKIVVVDFWATWCPPCVAEIPGYTELVRKYGKDGLAIVGVSIDEAGPAVVKAFAEKKGINYHVVMGDESIAAAFGGLQVVPTTFLIDRNGQIRDRKEGAEPVAVYEKKIQALLN